MFTLLKKSLLGVALSLITVLPASAENYVGLHDNNNLWMKVGSVDAPWMEIAYDPSTINGIESSGDRVAYSDAAGNLWIKEGAYGGWTLVAQEVSNWDINGNQIAFIANNGDLFYKDGPLTAPWTTEAYDAITVSLSPNRIAYTDNYDPYGGTVELWAVQNGEFPLYWYEANVAAPIINGSVNYPQIQVTDNRLAFLSGDYTQFYVKEGALNTPWVANIIDPSYTFGFAMTDNRLCVNLADSATVTPIYCKDGSLSGPWIEVSSNAYLLSLNDNEIAVQSQEPYDPLDALQIYNGSWTTLDQGLGLSVPTQ